jgi:hypothetical protein
MDLPDRCNLLNGGGTLILTPTLLLCAFGHMGGKSLSAVVQVT